MVTHPSGSAGIQGATGPAGAQGATGPQGLDGATGPQGPSGSQGPQGATGVVSVTQTFVNDVYAQTYNYNGSTFSSSLLLATSDTAFKYYGGVLANNGKIYCIPHTANAIGIINPVDKTITSGSITGTMATNNTKWAGGALGVDGKIYAVPSLNSTATYTSSILIINPATSTFTTSSMGFAFEVFTSGSANNGSFIGAVAAPDNKIYGIPSAGKGILIIDPIAGTAITSSMGLASDVFTFTSGGLGNKWQGGCLASDGKIYCAPATAQSVLIIDPISGTATTSSFGINLIGGSKYSGVVMGNDNKLYFIPSSAQNVMILDIATQTATSSSFNQTLSATLKFYGGTLGADGNIYCFPRNATHGLVINTVKQTATTASMGTFSSSTNKIASAILGPDGVIYGIPGSLTGSFTITSTNAPGLSDYMTLSPHLNKY